MNYQFLLKVTSKFIDYCYYFGPFCLSMFLVLSVYYISSLDELDGDSNAYEYYDYEEGTATKLEFTSVNSPHRDSSIALTKSQDTISAMQKETRSNKTDFKRSKK